MALFYFSQGRPKAFRVHCGQAWSQKETVANCLLGCPASRGVFGPFSGCLFGAKKRPKKDPQTGPTNASKKDDCQRQKRPKNGAKIDEKTTPNNMLEKRHAKGRGTAKKQVLGAPCKLKMGISLGRGYKNEQWQLTCSRSLSAHKNSYF